MSPDECTSQTLTIHYLTVCIPVFQKGLGVGNGLTHLSNSIAWEADCECYSTGDRFIYNDQTGALIFDADGTRAESGRAIAFLNPGDTLRASNIRIV